MIKMLLNTEYGQVWKKKNKKEPKKKPKKKTKKNKEQREKKGSFPNRSTIKATDRFTGVKIND